MRGSSTVWPQPSRGCSGRSVDEMPQSALDEAAFLHHDTQYFNLQLDNVRAKTHNSMIK